MLDNKWKNIKDNMLIICFFGIITTLLTVVFIKLGTIILNSDGSFHFSRLEELYQDFRNGSMAFIASHTFNSTGVGTFLFYPSILLYPWVILRLIFSPVTAFYIWYGLMLFVTMCIAYYSMWLFDKDRIRAIFFGVLYSIFPYHIHLGVVHTVIGEFLAYTFMPLLFVGLYYCLTNKEKWYLLGISWSLILYSHVISAYMTILCVIIISIIYVLTDPQSIKRTIINLSKNAVLVILLSSFILVPFITDFINAGINSPNSETFGFLDTLQNIVGISLTNTADSNKSIGILALFTVIVGWYFVKDSRTKEKVIYGLGVFFLLCTSTVVPWQLFNNTVVGKILGVIQFPYRLNTYAGLFLMVTFSLIISRFIHSIANKKARVLFNIGIMIFLIISYYGSLTSLFVKIHTSQGNLLKNNTELTAFIPNDAVIKKENYNNIFKYIILYGETDYYPKAAFNKFENNISEEVNPKINSILLHKVIVDGKEKVKIPKVASNCIEYNVKVDKKEKIDVPVLAYKRTTVMLNEKNINYAISSRGTVVVDGNKGNNRISVSYQPSKLLYIGMMVSVITWIGLFIGLIFSKKDKLIR
ncbi:6-pyruvoyl-tetrahydropterin synthase-related protein [Ligilactobacillus salivarius]|uniref:6-pyruvoyl-tetrahydropterin synthase-related protein n=1 Tax=Ligilactobacillus salivarius TaxID=1624 RepID=UPI002023619D|nr:6-pyruvoyl-tetrahydropterin synthase-related protein [Ligilactobacillus salivarius]URI12686.1 6-pyruvoyl-tetrahydropterin synthase-related protein [Ligilactobacillus salivarius]UUB34511.1 6-pyruvoyl-tetrahydropterin synthase-related protein [Ligilactobacillus salivarius]